MKSLQTFWLGDNTTGGWLSLEYYAYSWALSCFTLKTYADGATLHTTSKGADWLIGELDLPYSNVELSLDGYEVFDKKAWVMHKHHTYSLQSEGFIHLDGDAYLFSPIDQELKSADLIAQNLEFDHPYMNANLLIADTFPYVPSHIATNNRTKLCSVNAGVLGGNNTDFFKEFYQEAEKFLIENQQHLTRLSSLELNSYLDQCMFKQMADERGLKISTILKYDVGYPENYQLDRFYALPSGIDYLHLMNYKHNPTICEQLAQRLWLEAPDLYDRCRRITRLAVGSKHFVQLPDTDISLKTDSSLSTTKDDNFTSKVFSVEIGIDIKRQETLLQDANNFEQGKKEFLGSLPNAETIWTNWRGNSMQVNETLSLPPYQYEKLSVQYGSYCTRINTEWNWAERSEFAEQKGMNDLNANRTKDPAYYETLFYVAPHLETVREQILDGLSILLLDNVEEAKSYAELVDSTISLILQHQPQADSSVLENRVEDRLRYFLYLGVLRFADE